MTIQKNLVLKDPNKKPILYDVYYKSTGEAKPVVLFCHGYKGFKDWGAWHLVAQSFAEAGFFFVKFNFSHNGGTLQQPIDFPDLEAFSNNNYSLELDDLDRMIEHITHEHSFKEEVDVEHLSLIGHSRGGGIVMIKAEEHPLIKKVISWAGVSDFKSRFNIGSEGFKEWERTGFIYVENGRTKQQMPHKFQFYEDYINNEHRLTIRRAVENLKIPQLIIQGSEDLAVQVEEAETLHHWNPDSELVILKGADHVFNSRHPWQEEHLPENLNKVVELSIDFLK